MGNEKIHFCAPVLDRFRFTFGSERRNGGQPEPYSAETMKALDELFADIGTYPHITITAYGSCFSKLNEAA